MRQRNLKAGSAREQLYGNQEHDNHHLDDGHHEYITFPWWLVAAVVLVVFSVVLAVRLWLS